MNTVLLVLMLGTPQFFIKFPTEEACFKKMKDYTAMVTRKRPNMFVAKCVAPDSLEITTMLKDVEKKPEERKK
jgi:hypothetical protein